MAPGEVNAGDGDVCGLSFFQKLADDIQTEAFQIWEVLAAVAEDEIRVEFFERVDEVEAFFVRKNLERSEN